MAIEPVLLFDKVRCALCFHDVECCLTPLCELDSSRSTPESASARDSSVPAVARTTRYALETNWTIMKRSLQSLHSVARSATASTRVVPSTLQACTHHGRSAVVNTPLKGRPLATVADLKVAKDLDIQSSTTVHVAPAQDMLGFEVSSGGQVQDPLAGSATNVGRPIYLDAQATTPTDPRVLDAMLPYMTNQYGNPHSKTHAYGWETEKAVEQGRKVRAGN